MSKKKTRVREIEEIDPAELAGWTTQRLLGRMRRLRTCEESFELSDMTREEFAQSEGILFKETAAWKRAYKDLKSILDDREHVPRRGTRR